MSLLILFQGGSAPAEVTSTASWSQAAGAWAATATETIPATAAFSQAAGTWAATSTAANPVSATAAWSQSASWSATLSELIDATAAFAQSATWEATAAESIPSTASWSQDATWSGTGLVANAVSAEAAFTQAAASWVAATDQLITGTASFEQAAASWDAVTSLALDASAAFSQAPGAWTATADHAEVIVEPPVGVSIRRGGLPVLQSRPVVRMTASFGQSAVWHATLDVDRTPVEFEELMLAGVL